MPMAYSDKQLEEAVSHVQGEWMLLADMASLLPQGRDRTLAEVAALEATFVHARCLVNFCSGGYAGNRNPADIQPANFLGVDWWPRDGQFDRKLRGRLRGQPGRAAPVVAACAGQGTCDLVGRLPCP